MIEPTAILIGTLQVPWAALLIVPAILAWWGLSHALYTAHGGRRIVMWLYLPLACVLGYLCSRTLYWYCHSEQYPSLGVALRNVKDYEGHAMLGVLLGAMLAAALLRALRIATSLPALYDALAPGAMLGMGLLYLTALFHTGCRGKALITIASMQHLPFASAVPTTQGGVEYRFATFFVSCLVLTVLSYVLLRYYEDHAERPGATATLCLLCFSAAEFLLDSTRYDAGFFQFNGFVSVLQIFAGVSVLAVVVVGSVHVLRRGGWRWRYPLLWLLSLGAMGATGWLEYLVQRHGDWHLKIYGMMSASCLCMVVFPYLIARSGWAGGVRGAVRSDGAREAREAGDADSAQKAREAGGADSAQKSREAGNDDSAQKAEEKARDAGSRERAGALPSRPTSVLLTALSALFAAIGLGAFFASRNKS